MAAVDKPITFRQQPILSHSSPPRQKSSSYFGIKAFGRILMAMIKDSLQTSPSRPPVPQILSPDHSHYDTILSRANQIQRQKEAEQDILAATEALLDVGFNATDHANHRAIVADVKRRLNLFQQNDYDSLIEERNINGKCGYVFCAQRPRSEDTSARFRILTGTGKGGNAFKVVPRKNLEQWCSERCARRGLYVRVQLSEEPAWMRAEGSVGEITLLEEVEVKRKDEADVGHLAEAIRGLDIQVASDGIAKALSALAVERGNRSRSGTALNVNGVVVRENIIETAAQPPDRHLGSDYGSIEGYKPHGLERPTEPSARNT